MSTAVLRSVPFQNGLEWFTTDADDAIKYLWRAGLKSADAVEDLKKAQWYVAREIDRLSKSAP